MNSFALTINGRMAVGPFIPFFKHNADTATNSLT